MSKKKPKCISCGQQLTPAHDDSDYTWTGVTDGKDSCYAGATQMPDGSFVSNQDHCTESEWV
jgi:hypothetical protein